MSTHPSRKISGTLRGFLNHSPFDSGILLAIFLLALPACPSYPLQALESHARPGSAFGSIPVPDFRIEATLPSTVPSDETTSAESTIIVNPVDNFTGTVTLSTPALPAELTCTSISPTTIPNSSGQATLSCSSNVAKAYFPIVTVTPQGGFDSEVNMTATVYPSVGLSVFLIPQSLVLGSGTATARFSASSPGDYTVTISGKSKSLSHTIMMVVAVTLVGQPDFEISTSSSSVNLEAGKPSITTVIITPSNGFTSEVTLVVEPQAGISCNVSPTSIQSPGTSTLTYNSTTAGEYTVAIQATGGASLHTINVNVHVADVSPATPAPARTLGLAPAIFYGVIAGIIVVIAAGAVLVLRLRLLTRRA